MIKLVGLTMISSCYLDTETKNEKIRQKMNKLCMRGMWGAKLASDKPAKNIYFIINIRYIVIQ